jgi:CarD family transcriptional regulator
MVPTANAGDVGLRKIIERKDVNQLLSYLASDKFFTQRDWKDRFKENSERMRSGSIFHVAEVFKNLVYLSRVKPLSFREKRMLDRARFLLISELSTVMNIRDIEIEARIEKAVTKACGKGPAPAAEA